MGMRELNAAMLVELRQATGLKKLRAKDILAWSTGKLEADEGEALVFLPGLKVNVVYAPPVKRGA